MNQKRKFFDYTLQQQNVANVLFGVGLILLLALFSAGASGAGLLHARSGLQLNWRQWLTRTLIARWLANRHF